MPESAIALPFLSPDIGEPVRLPLMLSPLPAGYPSPAQDYAENVLDLNEHLIKNPAASFWVKIQGDSMKNAGLFHDDLVLIDRSLDPQPGNIVLAIVDGEFTCKLYQKRQGKAYLVPANPDYAPIECREGVEIWGVIRNSIRSFLPCSR